MDVCTMIANFIQVFALRPAAQLILTALAVATTTRHDLCHDYAAPKEHAAGVCILKQVQERWWTHVAGDALFVTYG